jgi:hypothetical protein
VIYKESIPEHVSFTLTKSNPYFLKRRKYTLNLMVTGITQRKTSNSHSLNLHTHAYKM